MPNGFIVARGSPMEVYDTHLKDLPKLSVVFYVNHVSPYVPEIAMPNYIVTTHYQYIPILRDYYNDMGIPDTIPILTPCLLPEFVAADGSSALLAVRIALVRMGLQSVTVVGAPLTDKYKEFRPAWDDANKLWFRGRVRGTDGYPLELTTTTTI